jgi:general secretion pathway protein A
MYLNYYGLREPPFSLSPDPKFLYLSETHREGLANLTYGVAQRRGFVVVTGEVGTGKTTLIKALLAKLPQEVRLAFISNPTLSREEFFFLLAEAYRLGTVEHKAHFLIKFAQFLESAYRADENVVLIVDEAHCLSFELLEEIRLLSNLETPSCKLINIILAGQPELDQQLDSPRLLPLRQRITLRYHLRPLTFEETTHYIQGRLLRAGARDLGVFTEPAIKRIHAHTGGVPRLVNAVADRAMLTGYLQELRRIDEGIINECAIELKVPSRGDSTTHLIAGSVGGLSYVVKIAAIVFLLVVFLLFLWWDVLDVGG